MYIIAHPDDSLLFQSPSLLQNIQSNVNVLTVHLTAGDDGLAESYWAGREAGIRASYAQMAGVVNVWTTSTLTVGSYQLVLDSLTGQPNVAVIFMRLPDGGYPNGLGTALYGYQSLMQLWQGSESMITAVDGSATYTRTQLISTLASIMSLYQPQLIATQDYVGTFGEGDHMDHYATADLAQAAHELYTSPHNFVGYDGYPTTSLGANIAGSLLATKQAVFYTYGGFDDLTCSSSASCSATPYAAWLQREYTVGSVPVGLVASAGFAQSVASGSTVGLDGSASSNGGGGPLTYAWTQTAGPTVTLSSAATVQPTFTAPTGPATLTFSLTVSAGTGSSAASTVTITVAAPSGTITNVGPLALATASSQNTSTGQLASSAIDGVISGYPNTTTAEWATVNGGVGSWLLLTWPASYTIDYLVLFDRPNTSDQITSGTLTFSDGSSVSFGALPNAGTTGLTVTPPTAVTTTTVLMTVTGVSSTTLNVGLSELQAFGTAALTSVDTPIANAGLAQSVAAAAPVTLNGSASSDPKGAPITYVWTQTTGPTVTLSSSSAAQPTFTAPAVAAILTFSLTVSNSTTPSNPSSVTITVAAPADVPVANAGSAQSVASAAQVTLNGSGSSDPKGAPITYAWTQTAGPTVTLSSASTAQPTFTAPTGPVALTFSLTVSNVTTAGAPSLVTITVAAPSGTVTNVAPLAVATASSQNTSTGQLASSAIDGVISGYPNTTTAEWATVGGGVGSWLLLTWPTSYAIDYVVLFDRPNTNDQITSGTLTFSDGTSVTFGALPNAGTTGLTVTLPTAVTTTTLKMTVTGVSSTTVNVGLSELQAWGVVALASGDTPIANAGPAQSVASAAVVTLNGSASSDPKGAPITYAWTQTAGSTVTLSSKTAVQPTFTAPTGPATLTFSLVVSNSTTASAPSTVTITVAAAGTVTNVAPLAVATASSQNTSTGQLAGSAIDGVISGYPNTTTAEWATVNGKKGSWLLLTWPKSYTIDYVVLFDRPNTNDQITSGTLTFSDGTSVTFGALPNAGTTGLTVTLPKAVNTTTLKMTVTGVSSTTLNVGLSEIQAFGSAT
jgi:LmbE family N-acetylglucosaminyl deacetylase